MKKTSKRRASGRPYTSQSQLVIAGFETPFSQSLDPANRWVELAGKIPWDDLAGLHLKRYGRKATGRPPLNPRIVLGALIIKHLCNLDDRETISQITENIYMQYFLGYGAFSTQPPFDPSLFVEIRKLLGDDLIAEMNLRILECSGSKPDSTDDEKGGDTDRDDDRGKGELLLDATVSPQDIAYPTDLNLLGEARQMTEKIIDVLYGQGSFAKKPRTYRKVARKEYLKVAQNRNPSRKTVRKAVGKQLRYLRRNIAHIDKMLDTFESFPLTGKLQQQLWVVQTLYAQQQEMFTERKHCVEDRIQHPSTPYTPHGPWQGPGPNGVRRQTASFPGQWICLSGHHFMGRFQRRSPSE